jgi:glycosyltransferase involved in cell wall biosynthesis
MTGRPIDEGPGPDTGATAAAAPRPRIAVIRQGDRPRVNACLAAMLADAFPDHVVDDIDVLALVRARRLLYARTLVGAALEHAGPLVRGRTTPKKAWVTSRAFAGAVQRLVAEQVSPDTHRWTLQSQSLFPAAVPGVPHFVYTDHAHLVNLGYPGFDRSALAGRGFIMRERTVLRGATRVFVRSRHVRDVLVSTYGVAPDRVIDVGVGPNTPLPAEDRAPVWHGGRIVFVGVDWERKGGSVLLQAFERLQATHPGARLEIVGCSPPGAERPGVTLHGRLGEGAVAALLADCDVFCLPTTAEPFGVAFVEAMHAGLPLVGTNLGAVPDMVRDGETGRLVPVGDVRALHDALADLLDDPERAQAMGGRSRALARSRYAWPRVMDAIRGGITTALDAGEDRDDPRSVPLRVAALIVGMRIDGGAENVVRTLIAELRDTRCTASVITLRDIDPEIAGSIRELGAELVELPGRRMVSPRRFLRLLRELRTGRYDIIHTNLTGANLLGLAAGALLRIPVVVTLHSTRSSGDRHWYHGRLERFLIRHVAARVIAVGDETASARQVVLGDDVDIHVLPNAIAPTTLPDRAGRATLRHGFMLDPDAPLFITVGRMTPAKGHAQLLHAFGLLRTVVPDAELAIVGDGALRRAVESVVDELDLGGCVHLLGRRADARALVSAADVFVMSSVWEGLPMALLEAMDAGTAVVATDVGDVGRVLEGTPSRVVPPGEPAALAEAMVDTLRDLRAGRDLVSAGRAVVSNHYSSTAWADRVLDHYRAVATDADGAPVTTRC